MTDSSSNEEEAAFLQRQKVLSRWENEGGACKDEAQADAPEMTNAELVHLRIRVIALENLVITLLAEGSDRQIEVAREMANYISPRAGFTQHPLTTQAADHMIDMIDRAMPFRTMQSIMRATAAPSSPYKRTPVFDENTVPAGLRKEHRTKPGVWGVIRVLDGRLRYHVLDPVSETILDPEHPGLVLPDQPHFVEPLGPVRMQVEFYDHLPDPLAPQPGD